MHVQYANVNEAFYDLVEGIHTGDIRTIRTTSRAGDVLQVQEPVIISYEHPRQRVLFDASRDANPFFHLFESLWMLAGRNDVAPLAFYNSQIKDIASDDGRTFNGAYGYRWRHADSYDAWKDWKSVDQLSIIIEHLRAKPDSRRAVLQMWNVEDDLLKIDVTKDVCCNTAAYFLIRDTRPTDALEFVESPVYLDMTVTNRSNDLVWGMLGANVVHFSYLQEYIANCLGIEVGYFHQFTNNMHVYTERWTPKEYLAAAEHYQCYPTELGPKLVVDKAVFDREVSEFVKNHFASHQHAYVDPGYSEPFLRTVAWPMCMAFLAHKNGRSRVALDTYLPLVQAADWAKAGTEWIQRRIERKEQKNANAD